MSRSYHTQNDVSEGGYEGTKGGSINVKRLSRPISWGRRIYIYIYMYILYLEAYAIPPTHLTILRSSQKGRTWVSSWVVDRIVALSICRVCFHFCLSKQVRIADHGSKYGACLSLNRNRLWFLQGECDHLRVMVQLVACKANGSVGYQGVRIRVWQSFHARDYSVERHYQMRRSLIDVEAVFCSSCVIVIRGIHES